jgi:predicted component of type VI protein secretion system
MHTSESYRSLLERLIDEEANPHHQPFCVNAVLCELEMVLQSKAATPLLLNKDNAILDYGLQLNGIDALPAIEKLAEVGQRLLNAIQIFESRFMDVKLMQQTHSSEGTLYQFNADYFGEIIHFVILWDDVIDNATIRREKI